MIKKWKNINEKINVYTRIYNSAMKDDVNYYETANT